MEDVMKFETGFGKGISEFIFKKILEGKFGVKFGKFDIKEFNICSPVDGSKVAFNINVSFDLDKADIIRLIQKGEKNG